MNRRALAVIRGGVSEPDEGMRCLLVDPEQDADSLVRALSRALGRPPE